MINITRAQANQTTVNGIDQDWIVTLDSEHLYTLPAHFSVEETFKVRDIAEKMMKLAAEEMKAQEEQLSLVKINHIVSNGEARLEALARENERISTILEQHIGKAA